MFGVGIVEIAVMLLLVLAAVAAVMYAVLATLRRPVADEQVARGRRHQVVTSLFAAVAAVAAIPVGAAAGGAFGQSNVLPLLPSVVIAVACAVLWVGEVTFPRAGGQVRSTVLNARTPATVVPRAWLLVCVALAILDVAVFVVGAATADDGHAFSWRDGAVSGSRSPYPGLDYVLPQTVALALAGGLAWLVIRSATTRPTIPTDLDGDLVLRRASAARVLRWTAFGLASTGAGDLLILGLAVQEAPGWRVVGIIAVVAAAVLAFVALALVLVPVPQPGRLGHDQPAVAR